MVSASASSCPGSNSSSADNCKSSETVIALEASKMAATRGREIESSREIRACEKPASVNRTLSNEANSAASGATLRGRFPMPQIVPHTVPTPETPRQENQEKRLLAPLGYPPRAALPSERNREALPRPYPQQGMGLPAMQVPGQPPQTAQWSRQ
nr:MAG TPA: hypothetical protein [Caudoviricetes sp.]